MNYYNILNVNKNSTPEDIKKSYKTLATKYHPDKNTDNPIEAKKKFFEVSEAYQVLIDPIKKHAYDNNKYVKPNGDQNFNPYEMFNEFVNMMQEINNIFSMFNNVSPNENTGMSIHIITDEGIFHIEDSTPQIPQIFSIKDIISPKQCSIKAPILDAPHSAKRPSVATEEISPNKSIPHQITKDTPSQKFNVKNIDGTVQKILNDEELNSTINNLFKKK